jgi:transcriptional regulator with XRE-family HTH domain
MLAIAANIRRRRESLNLTQDYIAYKLNISQNAFSKIELGNTKLTVERLLHLAEILNCNPTDFIKVTDHTNLSKAQ